RVGQLANDALPGERPELAVGRVPHRLAGRFAHRVRKPQGWRRHGGVLAGFFSFPPPDARRGAAVISPPPLVHFAGRHPFSLVVAIVEPPFGAEVDSVRASQAVREGAELSLWRDFQAEAAIRNLGLMAAPEADVERDEKISVFVAGRPEDVFV